MANDKHIIYITYYDRTRVKAPTTADSFARAHALEYDANYCRQQIKSGANIKVTLVTRGDGVGASCTE